MGKSLYFISKSIFIRFGTTLIVQFHWWLNFKKKYQVSKGINFQTIMKVCIFFLVLLYTIVIVYVVSTAGTPVRDQYHSNTTPLALPIMSHSITARYPNTTLLTSHPPTITQHTNYHPNTTPLITHDYYPCIKVQVKLLLELIKKTLDRKHNNYLLILIVGLI